MKFIIMTIDGRVVMEGDNEHYFLPVSSAIDSPYKVAVFAEDNIDQWLKFFSFNVYKGNVYALPLSSNIE
ncbi:MAG: hypothetical protein QXP36_09195 [Conexivisphaerales archaeon]